VRKSEKRMFISMKGIVSWQHEIRSRDQPKGQYFTGTQRASQQMRSRMTAIRSDSPNNNLPPRAGISSHFINNGK
jgi:hypothetical protein